MLMVLMLGIQIYIFPPDLVREWPSLDLATAEIVLTDQIRIAALIGGPSACSPDRWGAGLGEPGRGYRCNLLRLFDAEP